MYCGFLLNRLEKVSIIVYDRNKLLNREVNMFYILILLLILIDQVSKYLVHTNLQTLGGISIIDGIFNLTYVENRGAAFGLMQGGQVFFIIATVLILIVGVYFVKKGRATSKFQEYFIAMIMSGAVGNLIDRIRLGYVIDFLDFEFIWSYVFNFADIMVVVGTILLCLSIVFEKGGDTDER